MSNGIALLLAVFVVFCILNVLAWSPSYISFSPHQERYERSIVSLNAKWEDDASNNLIQDNITTKQSTAVYGVSYIGGDPCGSKYNDDPFDATTKEDAFKPGLPDRMKDRIAALAAKKAAEEKERKGE